jgi:hypothetical protein
LLAIGDREGAKEFLEQSCENFEAKGKREDLARRAKVFLEMIQRNNREKMRMIDENPEITSDFLDLPTDKAGFWVNQNVEPRTVMA